ncbi:MAG TPA: hypothetical protein VE645_07575 [Pseudonocardiaceae bacterium]|jgi:hypothetical protein|nr:hypothetical protein [Pseudonocardiaceae bacterium]
MGTQQENYGEPEKSEGLGKRVRRFVDTELNRFLEKDDREERPGHPSDPDSAVPAGAAGSVHDSRRLHESDPTLEPGPTLAPDPPLESGAHRHPEPVDASRAGDAQRMGLLNDVAGMRDEWQRVQGTFVDDPQRAVQQASVLIDRTLDEIRANVGSGHTSEAMSTEDLRVSFQRYREFFQRLLSA